MEQTRDEKLWRLARRRASFKKALFNYMVIMAFLWAIWWFSGGRYTGFHHYPWPVWVMLAWGMILGFQYFEAYNGNSQELTEQEYEKLKRGTGV